jgi:Amt family ammonium transporter
MTSIDLLWVMMCACLVLLMQAGFAAFECGMVRHKNSTNVLLKNIVDFCLATLVFWTVGYGLMFGATQAGLIGSSMFLPDPQEPGAVAFLVFQIMFCGTATTIISGACAERMSFMGYLVVTTLVSAVIYPVFGHWVWATDAQGSPAGWLAKLGFHDFAGAGVVHLIGGLCALAAILLIGPRTGRFSGFKGRSGLKPANLSLSGLGALLLMVGWMGFNGGSTFAMDDRVPGILLNTVLAACSGCVAAIALSRMISGSIEAGPFMTGLLGGLVSVTAGSDVLTPGTAILAGVIGGGLAVLASRLLIRLKIDDAVDAVPVHAVAGGWGLLAVPLLARSSALEMPRLELLGIQAIGLAAAAVWAFGVGYILLRLIAVFIDLRVSALSEWIGLSRAEHERPHPKRPVTHRRMFINPSETDRDEDEDPNALAA